MVICIQVQKIHLSVRKIYAHLKSQEQEGMGGLPKMHRYELTYLRVQTKLESETFNNRVQCEINFSDSKPGAIIFDTCISLSYNRV